MKVVVIGIGLIGGSFARDLRRAFPGAEILGMDRDASHMAKALELGLVDDARWQAFSSKREAIEVERGRVWPDLPRHIQRRYDDFIARVEFFGDTVDAITLIDPLRGTVLEELDELTLFPSSHFVTGKDNLRRAMRTIKEELRLRLDELHAANRLVDPTGCGDAFVAGLLSQLTTLELRSETPGAEQMEKILMYANATGALTAQMKGVIPALHLVGQQLGLEGSGRGTSQRGEHGFDRGIELLQGEVSQFHGRFVPLGIHQQHPSQGTDFHRSVLPAR